MLIVVSQAIHMHNAILTLWLPRDSRLTKSYVGESFKAHTS